jgi:hypothetical protein
MFGGGDAQLTGGFVAKIVDVFKLKINLIKTWAKGAQD